MNLNLNEWKEFILENLFDIKKGKRLTSADQEEGTNNYIGAIDSNNGVANHIGQEPIHLGNTISLSYNGSVGEAFYQPEPYWATDDVNALYSRYEGFNEYIGLFLVAVLRKEKYKFSYGRKWTLENMNKTKINLPVQHNEDGTIFIDSCKKYSDEGYIPDWVFMENYITSLHHKPLTTKKHFNSNLLAKCIDWKEFVFGNLISDIHKSKAINKNDLSEAKNDSYIRYITRTAENNGCELLASLDELDDEFIEKGNAITVGDTTATCFYQDEQFITGDHIVVIRADWLNKFTGLFIVTLLSNEQYKYSYGRAYLKDRIQQTILKLPAIKVGNDFIPDWQFMEDYIKSLPYGDKL